jgi:hypothetical protein
LSNRIRQSSTAAKLPSGGAVDSRVRFVQRADCGTRSVGGGEGSSRVRANAANERLSSLSSRERGRKWEADAFEKLLRPLGPERFLAEIWNRKPYVISGRHADHYADLVTTADMDAIIGMSDLDPSAPERFIELVRYGASGQEAKPIPRTRHGLPDLQHVYQAYAEGYSINANFLQRRWQPVSSLCLDLQRVLHHPVVAYLFLTPPFTQAFEPHFDVWSTFILQIEGAKNWKLYHREVTSPLEHMRSSVGESQLGEPSFEVCLRAGDLLYVPAGYVHQALALDVPSLHLSVSIRTLHWAHILANAITLAAERDVSLRDELPVGFLNSDEARRELERRLHEFGGGVFKGIRLEDAFLPLGQRYEYAQTMPLDGHLVTINRIGDLDLDSVVTRRPGMMCMTRCTEAEAVLWFQGNLLRAPVGIERALRFVAQKERFVVREVPDCLTDDGKLVLVRRLVAEGLLAMAPD